MGLESEVLRTGQFPHRVIGQRNQDPTGAFLPSACLYRIQPTDQATDRLFRSVFDSEIRSKKKSKGKQERGNIILKKEFCGTVKEYLFCHRTANSPNQKLTTGPWYIACFGVCGSAGLRKTLGGLRYPASQANPVVHCFQSLGNSTPHPSNATGF